jgi:signal peptidase I
MKKIFIVLACIGGFMFSALIVARLTKVVVTYYIPAPSSMPTLVPGTIVLASVLKNPDHEAFIVYNHDNTAWIHRCVGMPNDIIEIKDGIVYRNGSKVNEPYVWNEYIISNKQLEAIEGYIKQSGNPTAVHTDSTTLISLTNIELKKYHLQLKRYNSPDTEYYPLYKDFHTAGYQVDNFGPLKIPAKKYFVLGDNRHNSLDSRYIGFVKEEDLIASIISK